jgi:hypothetical protein
MIRQWWKDIFFVYNRTVMLILASKFSAVPILSLRVGGRIATTVTAIINPNNLHIDGFYCQPGNQKEQLILLDMHIRDLAHKGIIIDDHNVLSEPDDLVRLKEILDINYSLIGKNVLVNKKKVGKVRDYSFDQASLFIQKIYVQPSLWKTINLSDLIFDRKNIVEVTDKYISFRGPEVAVREKAFSTKAFQANLSASASTTSEYR